MIISRDLKRTLTLKKVATVTMVIEHTSPHSVRGSAGIKLRKTLTIRDSTNGQVRDIRNFP